MKILIVDDERGIRESLRFTLDREYDLCFAENGIKGLEKYTEERPDLIISDIDMPEGSGYNMIKAIRNNDSKTPIVICSSPKNFSQRAELEAMVNIYSAPKPFNVFELRGQVKNILLGNQ